jgi:nucleoside-diphosphate-sugar epimerase
VIDHALRNWPDCTVLITGASGFLGSHLCDYLVHAGAQVHGLSRQVRSVSGVRWWQADAGDSQQMSEIMDAVHRLELPKAGPGGVYGRA